MSTATNNQRPVREDAERLDSSHAATQPVSGLPERTLLHDMIEQDLKHAYDGRMREWDRKHIQGRGTGVLEGIGPELTPEFAAFIEDGERNGPYWQPDGHEPAGQTNMVNSIAKVWYGKSEGGEVVTEGDTHQEPATPEGGGRGTVETHSETLRCACAGCLAARAALRENTIRGALRPKAGPSGAWADRSWDGPLAQFPGQTHEDTAET